MYRNGPVSAASVKARGQTIVRSVTAAVGAGGVAAAGVIALVLPGGVAHSTSTAHSPGASRPHSAAPSSTPSSQSSTGSDDSNSSTGSNDSTSSSGSSGFNTGNPPSPASGSSSATSGGS